MGHAGGGKGARPAEQGGAKGWGDVLKATMNPLADFTGQKDPFLDMAFKGAQKATKSGSVGSDMLSTYESRAKDYKKNYDKHRLTPVDQLNRPSRDQAVREARAKAKMKTKGPAGFTLLGEDE